MKPSIIKQLSAVFEFPVYVVSTEATRKKITKFDLLNGKLKKTIHLIVNNECTCKGYINRLRCKHIEMINSKFEGTGIPSTLAVAEVENVCNQLHKEDQKKYDYSEEELVQMGKVTSVTINRQVEEKRNVEIIYEKKFVAGSIVIRIRM